MFHKKAQQDFIWKTWSVLLDGCGLIWKTLFFFYSKYKLSKVYYLLDSWYLVSRLLRTLVCIGFFEKKKEKTVGGLEVKWVKRKDQSIKSGKLKSGHIIKISWNSTCLEPFFVWNHAIINILAWIFWTEINVIFYHFGLAKEFNHEVDSYDRAVLLPHKGQLISKANSKLLIWTKKPTKIFFVFLP